MKLEFAENAEIVARHKGKYMNCCVCRTEISADKREPYTFNGVQFMHNCCLLKFMTYMSERIASDPSLAGSFTKTLADIEATPVLPRDCDHVFRAEIVAHFE